MCTAKASQLKCAVLEWKKKEKGVHRQKLWYCVNTLLWITTMQKSLLWTCSKIKLDIFHTCIILDWLATFPPQSDSIKFKHTLRENTSRECVCALVGKLHRDFFVRALMPTNETMANDQTLIHKPLIVNKFFNALTSVNLWIWTIWKSHTSSMCQFYFTQFPL